MDGVGLGMCLSGVLGIFLMTMIQPLYVTFLSIIKFTSNRNKTLFMKPYMLPNSKIQDIRLLRYNVTIITVILQGK